MERNRRRISAQVREKFLNITRFNSEGGLYSPGARRFSLRRPGRTDKKQMTVKKGFIVSSTKLGYYKDRPGIVTEIYKDNIRGGSMLIVELLDTRQPIHIKNNEAARNILNKSYKDYLKDNGGRI